MTPTITGLLVFACLAGAALSGIRLRIALPQHHLTPETKDSVMVCMGLVATMAALVLGLLVASTKESYDTEKDEVTKMAAKIVYLDRVLANYGPEAGATRDLLRVTVEHLVDRVWPDDKSHHAELDPSASGAEALLTSIQRLPPDNDAQRSFKAMALVIASDLGQLRWLLFEQAETSISPPLLIVVVSWLAILFISFGVFAPSNPTAIAAFIVAALSVAGAIFLILELDLPFDGMVQISSEPMLNALAHLGR